VTDEEYVLTVYPDAKCSGGPVNLYWPGQGTRRKYIIIPSAISSMTIGEGDTPDEAWKKARVKAAARLERK